MNKFINIRNGKISVTTYRPCDCQATTLDDLITHAVAGSDDYLTASFDADELCVHPSAYDFELLADHIIEHERFDEVGFDANPYLSDDE